MTKFIDRSGLYRRWPSSRPVVSRTFEACLRERSIRFGIATISGLKALIVIVTFLHFFTLDPALGLCSATHPLETWLVKIESITSNLNLLFLARLRAWLTGS